MSLEVLTMGGGGESASIFITGLSESYTVSATKKDSELPDGYTRLKYIESNGKQRINTEWIPTSENVKVVAKAQILEVKSDQTCVFGATSWASPRAYSPSIYVTNGSVSSRCGSTELYGISTVSTDAAHVFTVEVKDGIVRVSVDENQDNRAFSGKFATKPMFLFAENYEGTAARFPTSLRMEYVYGYENGVLARNYVPCIDPNGVAGMYDLVTGVFKGSEGADPFVAGPVVGKTVQGKWNGTENRFEISKIKEYGMWTVTATNGEETATQDVLVDAAVEYEIEMSFQGNYLMLYYLGDECEDVTGGWKGYADKYASTMTGYVPTIARNSDNITATLSAMYHTGDLGLSANGGQMDLADYNKLMFKASASTHSQYTLVDVQVKSKINGTTYDSSQKTLAGVQLSYGVQSVPLGIRELNISEVSVGYPVFWLAVSNSGGTPKSTISVYACWLTKPDDWATLANKANITATSISDILATSSTLLANEEAVKFMVSKCTGDFMASAIQSSVFLTALESSPYKNIVHGNYHWSKFLALV